MKGERNLPDAATIRNVKHSCRARAPASNGVVELQMVVYASTTQRWATRDEDRDGDDGMVPQILFDYEEHGHYYRCGTGTTGHMSTPV